MKNCGSQISNQSWERAQCRTYRIDEGAEIEEHRVECDNAHRLQRVSVDDVGCCDCVSDLDPGCEEEEGDLTDHPVVVLVNGDTPEN